MLEAFHFKSIYSALCVCVFSLLVSEFLSGPGCPSLWCALVVVSLFVLVALDFWLCVFFIVALSLFSGEYFLLVLIRLLR